MEQEVIYTLPKDELGGAILRQLQSFFPPLSKDEERMISDCLEVVIPQCEYNFSHSENKYFSTEKEGRRIIRFDAFHSIQWMTLLYYLSHELYLRKSNLCDKVYYLNKIMHAVDLFYAIELPLHWGAEHPLGSVMGRAKYGNGFFFYQGCTVGGTRDREGSLFYPIIGENVHMFSNSSILGNSHIGNNVDIGAGAIVKNQNVPNDCVVFGESPNLIIKKKKQ
jgi:serine O-acetyltransferase